MVCGIEFQRSSPGMVIEYLKKVHSTFCTFKMVDQVISLDILIEYIVILLERLISHYKPNVRPVSKCSPDL